MAGAKTPGPQGTKSQLKAIAEAVRQQKYDDAVKQAKQLLENDPKNFQALIFLGFALDKLGSLDAAVPIYEDAATVKPTDPQAWQGLIKVFEKQGTRFLIKYKIAVIRLSTIFYDADDMYKCQDVVDKFVGFARLHATGQQLVDALAIQLPDSPIYPILEGRLPPPATTYHTIAGILEADESRRINTLIGERRTRLGARLVEVTAEVKREIFSQSTLTSIYNELINWTNDDELRRIYEEKLLAYRTERLGAFIGAAKRQELEEVRKLSKGMVIIRHPFQLAWDIAIDLEDPAEISNCDVSQLWDYYILFPTSNLGKVLSSFLTSHLSPFSQKAPPESKVKEEESKKKSTRQKTKSGDANAGPGPGPGKDIIDSDSGANDPPEVQPGQPTQSADTDTDTDPKKTLVSPPCLPTTDEERLKLLLDGIAESKSLLAYRMVGIWYQHSEDHFDNIELMRKALKYLDVRRAETGLELQNTKDALTVCLATALIYYQRPRNHPESKLLFERVLAHNANSTPALVGVGLIDEEELDYDAAISLLERALQRDKGDLRIRSEAAWVHSLRGEYDYARDELEACIPLLESQIGEAAKKLLAMTLYRLGVTLWRQDPSKSARKNRNGAYRHFLNALKNDLYLAPAYTSLGVYYADYAKDRTRAYKCFMKAIELSSAELEAGRRLVEIFADKRDWESIELVAQRVIESGQATPPWGSRKKPHGWPFAALGTAQLQKKEYNNAMMSFRKATRLNPSDYHSFVALAETYSRVRMYYSAIRAIDQAHKIQEAMPDSKQFATYEDWYTEFLLANIYRGTGDYGRAIDLYQSILHKRKNEQGVLLSLMQAMVESADACVKKGLFGEATEKAAGTLEFAASMATTSTARMPGFWTAVASACSVFSTIQGHLSDFPLATARRLFLASEDTSDTSDTSAAADVADAADSESEGHEAYKFLQDIDSVGTGIVTASGIFSDDEKVGVDLTRVLQATILSFKRALYYTTDDNRMQAAAYYNIGWAEYRAHSCLPDAVRSGLNGYLKASIHCFKGAIELEAKNRRFWNALGVATSSVHPAVSQHALCRSLYLGRNQASVWANYGTLALQHGDVELANKAFAAGQSSDPDDAASWVGQSFVALACGEADEARSLALHAVDLSDASSLVARQQYVISVFEHFVSDSTRDSAAATPASELARPLVALEQVHRLRPHDIPYKHLFALFRERINDTESTIDLLEGVCSVLETDYEATESRESLGRFTIARADLARAYVAAGACKEAIECSEMVLKLVGDTGDGDEDRSGGSELTTAERAKVQLSAYLAAGLARYFSNDFDGALGDFEQVLALSSIKSTSGEDTRDPDAVCLFAQVLWAIGREETRQRAQDELFEVIVAHPDHTQAILLLGAIAVLSGDKESGEAVAIELAGMQIRHEVSIQDHARISNLLHLLAESESPQSGLHQAQRNIMLHPHLPHGWANLAEVGDGENVETGDGDGNGDDAEVEDDGYDFASDMALWLTQDLLPPKGSLGPEDLARACVGTRRAANAQVSIFVAPWLHDSWQALADAIA